MIAPEVVTVEPDYSSYILLLTVLFTSTSGASPLSPQFASKMTL